VGGLFSLESISFVCRRFLVLWSPICLYFLLVAELLGIYWGSPCIYLLLPKCFVLFPVPAFEFGFWY
jgi:hypothetical protein